MGSNETSPPRSVLSGEAWHKVRSNLLKAALLDSEPVFPVIPQMELFLNVKGRNQIYFLSFCWPLLYQTGINALCNNISWSRLGAQAIPLENLACSTEGHSIQILSIATLPLKKKIICSPNYALIDMLLVITDRNLFWSAPSGRTDFWPCFPLWGPGPFVSVASTAALFESKSSAASTWPKNAAKWSGVEPQAVSRGRRPLWLPADNGAKAAAAGRRKLWASELCTRSTDKPTINLLDSTSAKVFKAKNIKKKTNHKHTQQVSIHLFVDDTIFVITCFSNIETLKRPAITMPSIIGDNMVWNQVQDLKGPKVYNVQKNCGDITSFL